MQDENNARESAAEELRACARPLLIVHVGPGKTGSSTIQHWLSDNADKLAARGILYPVADHDFGPQAFIGNAHGIAVRLSADSPTDLAGMLDGEMARYELLAKEGGCHAVVLSSEFLSLAHPENIAIFKQVAERRFDLRIVAAIRDPYWWLWSSWGQGVKRGGGSEAFRAYALRSKTENFELLRKFVGAFEDVRLIAYSEDRLFEDFIRATDLDLSGLENEVLPMVNRSLTKEETALLLLVNRVFADPKLSTAISNGMLFHAPNAVPYRHYDRETADLVREANSGMLTALQPLIVNPDVPVFSENDGPGDVFDMPTEINAELLRIALMGMRVMPVKRMDLAVQHLQKVARSPDSRCSELPSDFDKIRYLLLNEDVMLSGRDPVEHYLTSGRKEGRRYRSRPVEVPTDIALRKKER